MFNLRTLHSPPLPTCDERSWFKEEILIRLSLSLAGQPWYTDYKALEKYIGWYMSS